MVNWLNHRLESLLDLLDKNTITRSWSNKVEMQKPSLCLHYLFVHLKLTETKIAEISTLKEATRFNFLKSLAPESETNNCSIRKRIAWKLSLSDVCFISVWFLEGLT